MHLIVFQHHMSDSDATNPFRNLLQSFLKLNSQDPSIMGLANGFEVVSGDFTALVTEGRPHSNQVMIQIQVRGISLEDHKKVVSGLLMLHRFNYSGRQDHHWFVCIDEKDFLILVRFLPLSVTDAVTLQKELANGLAKAQNVGSLWFNAVESTPEIEELLSGI